MISFMSTPFVPGHQLSAGVRDAQNARVRDSLCATFVPTASKVWEVPSGNAAEVATNPGKLRKEGRQKQERLVAALCGNLLLLSGLRRLRLDLVNVLPACKSRCCP